MFKSRVAWLSWGASIGSTEAGVALRLGQGMEGAGRNRQQRSVPGPEAGGWLGFGLRRSEAGKAVKEVLDPLAAEGRGHQMG